MSIDELWNRRNLCSLAIYGRVNTCSPPQQRSRDRVWSSQRPECIFARRSRKSLGARDFIALDPDGNLILFAGPADERRPAWLSGKRPLRVSQQTTSGFCRPPPTLRGRPALRPFSRAAAALACGHPTLGAEYTLQQRRHIHIGIELRPVQAKAGRVNPAFGGQGSEELT